MRIGNAALFAKVGQRDDDAVDVVGVLLEELCAVLRVGIGFNRAVLRVFGSQNQSLRAGGFKAE